MTEDIDFMEDERGKRPGFLTTLAILTLITVGLGLLSGLFNLASGPNSAEQMKEMRVELTTSLDELRNAGMDSLADVMEQIQSMTEDINNHFYLASVLNILILGIGLFAVIKMLRGYRLGFHLYIVYCLLSAGSVYAYVAPGNIPTLVIGFNLFFSALFIFLYSRNLKWMTL